MASIQATLPTGDGRAFDPSAGRRPSDNRRGRSTVAVVSGPASPFRVGPRLSTDDGVELATYDLGGDGPPLLLCHATGFHALVWLPVAAHFAQRFHCLAFDCRGHGASGKAPDGDYDWRAMARDAMAVVDGLDLGRPLAAGHSAGGALLLLAEQDRPGLFRSLYCYEPVVPPVDPGPPDEHAPLLAGNTRRRREVFPSRAAALANYAGKLPFSRFDPAALQAYVDYGFDDLADGQVRLRCRREDEARVYEKALFHGAFRRLPEVGCPVTLVCGAALAHFGPEAIGAMATRLPTATTEILADVGHFGPMERPAKIADSITRAFGDIDGDIDGDGAIPDPVTPPR
jgi:pimeloyl-ACP methyl ester carboxylesterase